MSVIIPAVNGDGLRASFSNVSNPQSFTKLLWVQFPSSPTTIEELLYAQNTGATSFAGLFPVQFNSGKLSVASGAGVGDDGFASQPTWTNWNCFALSGTTAGANSLIGYWQDNAGGGFVSHSITGVSFTVDSDNICNGTMALATTVAYYMEWNTVLTPTQLATQFQSATPNVALGSLSRYLALTAAASAGTDTSGNGFNMTVTGSLTNGASNPTFGGAINLSGVSGSAGDTSVSGTGVLTAIGRSGSSAIAAAMTAQLLGSGSGSMGVVSLFNQVTPGSIFAIGVSGSSSLTELDGAGALTAIGITGSGSLVQVKGLAALQALGFTGSLAQADVENVAPGIMQALGIMGSSGIALLVLPTGPMPNLIGLNIWEALAALQKAGILVPAAIGYFGTFPVSVLWQPGTPASIAQDFLVIAQSVGVGSNPGVNAPIMLTVWEPPTGVIFP